MPMVDVPSETSTEVITETERRARVLDAAALEIEFRGKTNCDYNKQNGGVCVNGALAFASGIDPSSYDLGMSGLASGDIGRYQEALNFAGRGSWGESFGYCRIAAFNDRASAVEAAFLLRWRAEEIRDGWDA